MAFECSGSIGVQDVHVFRVCGCSGSTGVQGVQVFRMCRCSGCTCVQGVQVFRECRCSGCGCSGCADPEEDDIGDFCFFHVSFYKHLSFLPNMLLYPFIQFSTTETKSPPPTHEPSSSGQTLKGVRDVNLALLSG